MLKEVLSGAIKGFLFVAGLAVLVYVALLAVFT